VVCDRFLDSTLVYQGVARGLGLERVRALQTAALGEISPDLTLILDLAPEAGLARTHARSGAETRFERFEAEFHARLREAFREIAAEEPGRCAAVDAARPREDVASEIWRIVTERLPA
jgi:dTMP kinase